MNYILLSFSGLTSMIILGGSILISVETEQPSGLITNYRYGKFSVKGKKSILSIDVPKSWFKHFYIFAVFIYAYIFYMVTCTYIFQNEVPQEFMDILNSKCGRDRRASTSSTKTYIAIILLTLQVFRRFYDTHFVSVFGKDSKMSLLFYLAGLYHYPACALAILCEAPRFSFPKNFFSPYTETFNFSNISKVDIGVIVIFLWAWYHQHVDSKILANLRKNQNGTIVSDSHKVPYGDWFDYLTAPHQTAEIIMYMALTVLLWTNVTWCFVFIWVLSNQIQTILFTHWWYQEKFEDFPKNRKALIPFIY